LDALIGERRWESVIFFYKNTVSLNSFDWMWFLNWFRKYNTCGKRLMVLLDFWVL
jgi:hypothetical protein